MASALFSHEFLKCGLEPSRSAAANGGDSAPCYDMEQSKDLTQLEDTSEITHIYIDTTAPVMPFNILHYITSLRTF